MRPACRTLIVVSMRPGPYWLAIPDKIEISGVVSLPGSPDAVIKVAAAVSNNALFITIRTPQEKKSPGLLNLATVNNRGILKESPILSRVNGQFQKQSIER